MFYAEDYIPGDPGWGRPNLLDYHEGSKRLKVPSGPPKVFWDNDDPATGVLVFQFNDHLLDFRVLGVETLKAVRREYGSNSIRVCRLLLCQEAILEIGISQRLEKMGFTRVEQIRDDAFFCFEKVMKLRKAKDEQP
jgi:hypothetical protein